MSCTVSDIARYWSKSPFEPTPPLFGAPVGGWPGWNFA